MSVFVEIEAEVLRAESKHAPLHSAHEGLAVIMEEFDELKTEVWKGGSVPRDLAAMRKEAVQLGAMAARFVRDICDKRGSTP